MNIVLTNDAPTIAGGENFVLYLAVGLRRRGHTVTIAALLGSPLQTKAQEEGLHTLGVPYGTHGKEFKAYAALVHGLRGSSIDVMHSNAYTDRTIAAFAGRRLGAVNVASVHSCLSIQRNLLHRFRNRVLIDRFVPDGHSTETLLIDQDGIPARRIRVIHNGIPEDLIRTSEELRTRTRDEFNIPSEAIVFGAIGQMIPFKGHRYLLEAVSLLRDESDGFRCVIVGNGELEQSLRSQAASLGIEDRVIFPGHRTDLSAWYSLFDIFVMPSLDKGGETFPLVMVKALAAGLPVLGSDVGDISYMIQPGNGLLLPPADVTRLANAMRQLLTDRGTRADMGRSSRKLYEDTFTLAAMAQQFETLYEELMQMRRTEQSRWYD